MVLRIVEELFPGASYALSFKPEDTLLAILASIVGAVDEAAVRKD